MKKYIVKEGDTGVLELTDQDGNTEIYQPDCDLDKTQKLLYEFYELKTKNGTKVKDTFQVNGIDWFPNSVSLLYWQYFFQVVKYRSLIDKYLAGEIQFSQIKPGRFNNLVGMLMPNYGKQQNIKKLLKPLYHWIINLRNQFVVKKSGDLIFFRYGIDDFRTDELLSKLKERFSVLQVTWVPVKKLLNYFFDKSVYFSSSAVPCAKSSVKLRDDGDFIFQSALRYAQFVINTQIATFKSHRDVFKHLDYQLFFGLDDANIVYPFIYAAQESGIKTLGIQHGIYARRHEAYIMQGIDRYKWYDNVLVWGKYWNDNVLRHSKLFSNSFHVLASNKHSYDYSFFPKQGRKRTIMIPYEFLADSISVGEYIKTFIEKGYVIYFKPRLDRTLADQLHAYYLDKYEKDVKVVKKITPEIMAEMDVVAGTQTTLLFDLLPYNKPIWILETPFRLMYDMVEDKFARLITKDDMQRIDEIFEEEVGKKRSVDAVYFSGNKPVVEAVTEYLQKETASTSI